VAHCRAAHAHCTEDRSGEWRETPTTARPRFMLYSRHTATHTPPLRSVGPRSF
jgi:hypothetical protein